MKKFSKFIIIFGCGLFFGGLLLALTALALGSDIYQVGQRLDEMGMLRYSFWHWDWRTPHDGRYIAYDWERDLPAFPDHPNLPDTPYIPDTPDTPYIPDIPMNPDVPEAPEPGAYEIKYLDFDLGLGDIRIVTGEGFAIVYGNNNTRRLYSDSMSGDTWTISSNSVKLRRLWPWSYRHDDIKLTVTLPRDFVAESMIINLGAGNMQAEYLYAKDISLDVGLGNCQLGSLNAQHAQLNVSVGHLGVRTFNAGRADLEVGLGSMELNLTRPLDQYRCRVDVSLGSVQLGSSTYNGVSDIDVGSSDAPYSLNINCSLGSVKIEAGR